MSIYATYSSWHDICTTLPEPLQPYGLEFEVTLDRQD